jgi:small subunit ribosomal protein S2
MNIPTLDAMMASGMHYGYSRTRRHPSVKTSLYGTKNTTDLIDLEKTTKQLEKACEMIASLKGTGKQILIVGTKPEIRDIVANTATALDMPAVTERWIGGALTNWKEIKGRLNHMKDLLDKQEKNELVFKTKKEKLLIEREIEKLKKKFGAMHNLSGIPALIIIIDSKNEEICATEARNMGVPTISLSNTDCDITKVTCPVLGNDAQRASVKLFLDTIKEAYQG